MCIRDRTGTLWGEATGLTWWSLAGFFGAGWESWNLYVGKQHSNLWQETGDKLPAVVKHLCPYCFSCVSNVYACVNFNLVPIHISSQNERHDVQGPAPRFRIPLPLPPEIGCINLTLWKYYHWHSFPVNKLFSTSFDSSRCQCVT